MDLSPAAYADGKFPPGCSSKDFVRIDQADFQARLDCCTLLTICMCTKRDGTQLVQVSLPMLLVNISAVH